MKFIKHIPGYTFLLLVFLSAFAHAETWLFDFGPATQNTAPGYNNINNPGIQTHTGLINADGLTTGVSLTVSIPFNTDGTNPNGTTTPAPETGFASSATRDSFFGNVAVFQGISAPNAQMRLTGLDPAQRYDFSIFASRMGVTDNRETEYKITGANSATAYLDASGNTANVATINDIQPAADGSIVIDLAPGSANTNSTKFYYIGAIKIVSRTIVPDTCEASDPTRDDKLTKYTYVDGVSPYTMGHWLYRPAGYSYAPCKKYPLLVWLHGLGETCSKGSLDILNKSSLNSPGYQILQGTAYSNQRPFLNGIILQPQTCSSWNVSNIDAMIEYVKTQVRVDDERIYVTGLSLGGGGTWAYAASKYTKVAAIVPVAGTESALSSINAASHVPTWAFHNYNDTNVGPGLGPVTDLFRCKSYTHRECAVEHIDRMIPFSTTKVMQNYSANGGATQAATDRTVALGNTLPGDLLPTQWNWNDGRAPLDNSAKTLMTIYAVSGHSGWSATYSSQAMWQWLYAQQREPAPTLKISSQTITPVNASISSAATLVVSAKISLGGIPVASVSADLKSLGGSNVQPMIYDSVSKTYKLTYTLPATGVSVGTKGVGIVAVDTSGNRTLKFVTFTVDP